MASARAALPCFLLLSLTACTSDTPPHAPGHDDEETCLTFSAQDVPAWSACLGDPLAFVPEALGRMDLGRCLGAWEDLDDGSRRALASSGRIHVDPRCRFIPGPGAPSAAALLSLGLPVDLNTATFEDLQALPGIGPALAGRIVTSRRDKGPFCAIDDLARVKGVGVKTVERLRPQLSASCSSGPTSSR